MRIHHPFRLLTMIALSICACSGPNAADPRLLDSKSADRAGAEEERLRRMQLVRVITTDDGEVKELDTNSFMSDVIFEGCPGRVGVFPPHVNCRNQGNACEAMLCFARLDKCAGEIALGVASGTGAALTMTSFIDGVEQEVRVPPQPAAVNATLAIEAARRFRQTMEYTTSMLIGRRFERNDQPGPDGVCSNADLEATGADGKRRHEAAVSLFVNAYQEGRKAFGVALDNTLAVADAELSSTPSLELARTRAISNRALSRTAAAHLMVGGIPGFLGSTSEAFCTAGRLSGPEAAALAVFREAAPSPRDVIDLDVDIEALVNGDGTGTQPMSGSLRERLADAWGSTEIPLNRPLWEVYSLRQADFEAAREFLKDEIEIFSRSLGARLRPKPLHGDHVPAFDRFAGVAGSPPARDPVYWTALAAVRTVDESPNLEAHHWRGSGVLEALAMAGDLNQEHEHQFPWADTLAEFVDAAHTWAGHILRRPELQPEAPGAPAGVREGVFDPLGLVVGSDEYGGRFMQCRMASGDHQLRLFGYSPTDNIIMVRDEDLFECATRGSVEGATCVLPDFTELPDLTANIIRLNDELASPFGPFDTELRTVVPSSMVDQSRWYLLKPRQAGNANPGAGEWQPIMGLKLYEQLLPPPGATTCLDTPIVPEAIENTARVLAPSREWCGASFESCAGTKFDERLPLEDELADDQDGVESSWRHYLALARQAASEADLLGQEYVQAGLQEDFRLEEIDLRQIAREDRAASEMQRLQEICGTTVDPGQLLEALGEDLEGRLDLSEVDQGSCTLGPPELPCLAGRRVLTTGAALAEGASGGFGPATPVPGLKKLYDCIRAFGETARVHLGDSDVCIERLPSTSPRVTIPDGGCGACGTVECPLGTCAECLPAATGLHFFNTPSILSPPPASLCDSVRALRANPASSHAEGQRLLSEITDTTTFALTNVKILGESVTVELDYNGHVIASVSGATFSTGRPGAIRTDQWPCLGDQQNSCANGDGLFCQTWDCSVREQRAEIGHRLYKAALAAKFSTWEAGDPKPVVDAPYYAHEAVRPSNGTPSNNGVLVDQINVPVSSNGIWRIFDGDLLTPGSNPAFAHALGGEEFPVVGTAPYSQFAIRTVATNVADHLRAFWGGMAAGDGEAGYFRRALQYGADDPPLRSQSVQSAAGVEPNFAVDICPEAQNACPTSYVRSGFKNLGLEVSGNHNFPVIGGKALAATQLYPTLTYDRETLMDALELLCEGAAGGGEGGPCNLASPPPLNSVEDFDGFGRYLQCLGDEINRQAAMVSFALPADAVENLNNGATAHAARGGDMTIAISELRRALMDVAKSGPVVGGTVRRFGQDLRALKSALSRLDIAKQMSDIHLKSQVAQQVTNCVASALGAATLGELGGGAGAAAATCANSLAQIGFALELNRLEDTDKQLARDHTLAEFAGRTIDYTTTLETEIIRLSQALEGVKQQTEVIENLKQQARRSVDAALWQLSRQASNEGQITDTLGNIKEAARLRYQRSFKNAQRMAFLAKRAIEQRLGFSLAEMVEDLPLVPAPASWEGTVCTTTGIDYEALRESGQGENFADGFIGDYVTKLEQVVESYRLSHNFHEGRDTAIVSLRDDVHNVRVRCEVESRNRLLFASRLDSAVADLGQSIAGWEVADCRTESVDLGDGEIVEQVLPDCVVARPHAEAPFFHPEIGQQPVPGYALLFGAPTCTPETCGYQEGASLRQRVLLEPGRYRFSWYTLEALGDGGAIAGVARTDDGTLIPRPALDCEMASDGLEPCSGFIVGEDGDWNRAYFMFDVSETGTFSVGFERPSELQPEITIAAPMLEKLDSPSRASTRPEPTPFIDTTDTLTVKLAVCEDTTGETFRAQKWDRNCINLCPDGYSSDCRDKLRTECFWETSFHVSQRGIEAGHIFNQSGFARGNFNYRIESVGLNFVGTGIRECADSNLPSTCHAGGYVPYSIIHDGPYYVRNHKGEDYRAYLFTGQIEHARGLGTERYLTNPLGDADRSLIEPYLRSELNGRPLDGEFILRIWEEPGLDFDAIEDVQLVLNYRYWTRFN